jgi:D-glycero-alpha-D-manno-heptose-7-phosphate kinase
VRHGAAHPRIVARAPARLDFGGGWTDVPPYCEREGGAVCNIAIALYATVSVTSTENPVEHRDALIVAAIRRSAITHVDMSLGNDFPVGAGLGGSSAVGVAAAGALAFFANVPLSRHDLAMRSRETEVEEMGMPGGYQDHFAAAFGGALLLEFGNSDVRVEQLPISPGFTTSFARRAVLVYTGESRISGTTITAVRDAYLSGDTLVVQSLARMRSLAHEQAHAIRQADVDHLAALMGEHWLHQRALHPTITTSRIEEIMKVAAQSGSLGAKAMGASGGGCVLAIAQDGREEELAHALEPLGTRLPFEVDTTGFQIL